MNVRHVLHPIHVYICKAKLKNCTGCEPYSRLEGITVLRMSISKGNFGSENSYKLTKYSQSYGTVCQLALAGLKGL